MTTDVVHAAAREAYRAGLCIVPPAEDGTKRPLPDDSGKWDPFKMRRPTADELRRWYPGRAGIGVITGDVSRRCECWDFDCRRTYEAFVDAARELGLGDTVERIEAGYCDDTPGGGVRWLVRYADAVDREPGGRIVLARRPGEAGEPKVVTLVELPAFNIVAPTNGRVHPSGRPYVRRSGDFATIGTYTVEERDALIGLARSFDQMPDIVVRDPAADRGSGGTRPGDIWAMRTSWSEILEPHGWTKVFTRGSTAYWRRPGKSHGWSATTGRTSADTLAVFSTSTEFDEVVETRKTYTKFAAFAVLKHGGDFAAAARSLAALGYGEPAPQQNGNTSSSRPRQERREEPVAELRYRLTPLSTIKPLPVHWLLRDRIPLGEITLTPGRAGLGKSLYHCWLVARLTSGTLDGRYYGTPRACVVAATEDSYARTIVPRLIAAGADLDLVYRIDVATAAGDELTLTLPRDCEGLRSMIVEGRAVLVSVDPLLSRVDRELDTHNNRQVRDALEPLQAIAEETECAIVGNAHFRKAVGADPLTMITASSAFGEVVRAAIGFARDPKADDGAVVLSQIKNNLGKVSMPSQRFVVDEVWIDTEEGPATASVGLLRFTGDSERSVADILAERGNADEEPEAVEFLRDALADGLWHPAREIEAEAKSLDISPKQLRRAREKLNIESRPDRSEGGQRITGWSWRLPNSLDAHAPGHLDEGHLESTAESNCAATQSDAVDSSRRPSREGGHLEGHVGSGDGSGATATCRVCGRTLAPSEPANMACANCRSGRTERPHAGELDAIFSSPSSSSTNDDLPPLIETDAEEGDEPW